MRAHELFQDETELLERRRKELISQLMQLWRVNAYDYRTLPLRYQFLLSEKKAGNLQLRYNKKLYSVNRVNPGVLREYPDIPFLRILCEEVAYASIDGMSLSELTCQLSRLELDLTANCAYRTLKAWVADASYILNMKIRMNVKRQALAVKQ